MVPVLLHRVALEPGDALTIGVDAPSRTSRHEGDETGFPEVPDVEMMFE